MVAALDGEAEVVAFARENLLGGGGLGALRSDCYPVLPGYAARRSRSGYHAG